MAFRGGRGRGRGPYGQSLAGFAKQEKYEIYPELKEYPDVNLKQKEEFRNLVSSGDALYKFWTKSPYHLGFIDPERNKDIKKDPLSEYMNMTDDYVPAELASRNVRPRNKKVRWDPQSDLQSLDIFEKLDQGYEGQDGEKEKKEDDDDDNDEDDENIEEEEEDSGDDYDQNPDFDDDEDDFNMEEDLGDDEGSY